VDLKFEASLISQCTFSYVLPNSHLKRNRKAHVRVSVPFKIPSENQKHEKLTGRIFQ
jgi:hypothetical protein